MSDPLCKACGESCDCGERPHDAKCAACSICLELHDPACDGCEVCADETNGKDAAFGSRVLPKHVHIVTGSRR